jgi:hypothetical protein
MRSSATPEAHLITLAQPTDIRNDAQAFQRLVSTDTVKERAAQLFERGFQTRGPVELELAAALGQLGQPSG